MNDLYLIGNGFDLAHGLKTSYNDFLLWYLKESYSSTNPRNDYSDELISFHRMYTNLIQDHNLVSTLIGEFEKLSVSINYKHDFFKKIIGNYHDYKWVDIEYEYYMALVDFYKRLEKVGVSRDKRIDKELASLNNCFDSIKKKLVAYLISIQISSKQENRQIESILLEGTGPESKEKGEKLFLNFNYTATAELYSRKNFPNKNNLIYIHGELRNSNNPIIFGYGD